MIWWFNYPHWGLESFGTHLFWLTIFQSGLLYNWVDYVLGNTFSMCPAEIKYTTTCKTTNENPLMFYLQRHDNTRGFQTCFFSIVSLPKRLPIQSLEAQYVNLEQRIVYANRVVMCQEGGKFGNAKPIWQAKVPIITGCGCHDNRGNYASACASAQ